MSSSVGSSSHSLVEKDTESDESGSFNTAQGADHRAGGPGAIVSVTEVFLSREGFVIMGGSAHGC